MAYKDTFYSDYTDYSRYSRYYEQYDEYAEYSKYSNYYNYSNYSDYDDSYYEYSRSYSNTCSNTGCKNTHTDYSESYTCSNSYNKCMVCTNSYYNASPCSNTYSDYADCEVSYYNYKDCEVSYSNCTNVCSHTCTNYADCETSYIDCTNQCSVTWSYTNYADISNTNKGAAYTFTWVQPALKATTAEGVKQITDPVQYTAVLTELKEKINHLAANKGRNKVTANSTTTSGSVITDKYEGLRATLNALYTDLKQSSSSVTPSVKYKRVGGDKIYEMKSQIDALAQATITYTNYVNTSSNAAVSGSTNSTYIDVTISGSTPYTDYSICTQGIKYGDNQYT